MSEELAYSIHLGNDKNKTNKAREIAKKNSSGTTSFSNNAIQNAQCLSKVNKHNLRDYDNNKEMIEVIYGSNIKMFKNYIFKNLSNHELNTMKNKLVKIEKLKTILSIYQIANFGTWLVNL